MALSPERIDAICVTLINKLPNYTITDIFNIRERIDAMQNDTLRRTLDIITWQHLLDREEKAHEILTLHFEILTEEEKKGCDTFMYECCMDAFLRDLELFNITLEEAHFLHQTNQLF